MKTVEYFRNEVKRMGKVLCANNVPQYLFNVASSATHTSAPHLEIVNDEVGFVTRAVPNRLSYVLTAQGTSQYGRI